MYLETTPYQRYQVYSLLKAVPLSFLVDHIENGLNQVGLVTDNRSKQPIKLAYEDAQGYVEIIPINDLIHRIATPLFISQLSALLFWNMMKALSISLLLTVSMARWLVQYGQSVAKDTVLRGSTLCTAYELAHCVKTRFKNNVSELSVAGIPLPKQAETQHIWMNGTTDSGKTVAFSDLLSQIRQHHRRVVVYNILGVYVAHFYRPGKDVIFNPFDQWFPGWTPWVECHHSVDYDMLAASQIPIAPGRVNEDPFWKTAARSLYAATLRALDKAGKARNQVLLRYLITADLDALRALLQHKEAASLVAKDLEKTALSVKAILNNYIKGMRFLQDDGPVFSLRDWVRRDNDDSWIFMTSRPDYHDALMPLISTWYDIAITEALSLPNNANRCLYFPLDELPTLHYLPVLKKGLPPGRQKGLSFILGTQDLSQLRVNYGADHANALIGNANTKLILRTVSDADTMAHVFNQSEYQENTESVSYDVQNKRQGMSMSQRSHMRSVVLPAELQNLEDLTGFLRVPGSYPIAKVALNYVHYDAPNPCLIPREDDRDGWIVHDIPNAINNDKTMTTHLSDNALNQQDDKPVVAPTDPVKQASRLKIPASSRVQPTLTQPNGLLNTGLKDDNYSV